MIEDAASLVLVTSFLDEAIADAISVYFSLPLHSGYQDSTIYIQAQCTLESFTLVLPTAEYTQLAVEESVCAILKELLRPITIQLLDG